MLKRSMQLAIILSTLATPSYACGCHAAAVAAGGGVGAAAFFAPLQAVILTAPEWINLNVWEELGLSVERKYPQHA